MKIWVDAHVAAPKGWEWAYSTTQAIELIHLHSDQEIEVVSIGRDTGNHFVYGGDYINIEKYCEAAGRKINIQKHMVIREGDLG